MRVVTKVINNSYPIKIYDYSSEKFIYNDKDIEVKDKKLKLMYLISLASNWESSNESVNNGFYVMIELEKNCYEYFFDKSLPNNFNLFISEVKNLVEEG